MKLKKVAMETEDITAFLCSLCITLPTDQAWSFMDTTEVRRVTRLKACFSPMPDVTSGALRTTQLGRA
jgi:hypothetical protein